MKFILMDFRICYFVVGGFVVVVNWVVWFLLFWIMFYVVVVMFVMVIGMVIGFFIYKYFVFECIDWLIWL